MPRFVLVAKALRLYDDEHLLHKTTLDEVPALFGIATLISKRAFDLVVSLLASVLWLPVLLVCSLAVAITSGWPVFYVSQRRVYRSRSMRVIKVRTMVKGADEIVNRDTAPVGEVRFLNIPAHSPLYTRVGRIIERFHLTELPQIFHVLTGRMSLVGSRPLPENVILSLKEKYPYAEDRFLTKSGLTGPVQLVGREALSDELRLTLEIEYCQACLNSYSVRLDLLILSYTVLIALRVVPPRSASEMRHLLSRYCVTGPSQEGSVGATSDRIHGFEN